ncbi:hypothetical protein ACFQ0B_36930 [Nonomuraea thailandensis]
MFRKSAGLAAGLALATTVTGLVALTPPTVAHATATAAEAAAPHAGVASAAAVAAAAPILWRACAGEGVPAGMECGALDVPVDWSRPRGKQVRLELVRLPATEPARRIGSVLGVPGGPGGSGVEDLKRAAPT